ncbi:MAG: hypothetical protein LBS39_00155, partial [Campylobacteraceae bacterium]|nr:hypothetical protein [Campylobacteraceae bacterium]
KSGLSIFWCENLKPYNKLIPTLKEYPNSIIITVDDDIYYPKNMLEKLYQAYQKQPNMVHCHRAHRITFKNGQIEPYKNWKFSVEKVNPSFLNFLTGVGGVLYPPNIFHEDILRKDIFVKLAPNADDIWFWAMTVLNNVKINVVDDCDKKLFCVEDTQEIGLWHENLTNGKNDEQLNNIFKYYPQLLKALQSSLENTDKYSLERIKDILQDKLLSNVQFKYNLRIHSEKAVVIEILDLKISYDITPRENDIIVEIVLRKNCDESFIRNLYPKIPKNKNYTMIYVLSVTTVETKLIDFIKKELDRVINKIPLIKQVQSA